MDTNGTRCVPLRPARLSLPAEGCQERQSTKICAPVAPSRASDLRPESTRSVLHFVKSHPWYTLWPIMAHYGPMVETS